MSSLRLRSPAPVTIVDGTGDLRELETLSRSLEEHTHASNTRRAYDQAWRSFTAFCAEHDLNSLPADPETVRWYVAGMTAPDGRPPYAVSTIRQRLAGIADRHLREGHLDPTAHLGVVNLVRGFQKQRPRRPVRKKPLLLDDVLQIIRAMDHRSFPAGVAAARDTVAIWLGFAGAMRRSEAAGLSLDSVELHRQDGVIIHVGRSKADQENMLPDVVVLPYGHRPNTCAPCAVHRWVALMKAAKADNRSRVTDVDQRLRDVQRSGHVCGKTGSKRPPLITNADLRSAAPLLRAVYRNRHSVTVHERGVTGDALHTMLRTRMKEARMPSEDYGFHSLRAGHVTQARRNGAPTEEIMRAGRWRNQDTVNIYDREYNPASRNSVTRLGL